MDDRRFRQLALRAKDSLSAHGSLLRSWDGLDANRVQAGWGARPHSRSETLNCGFQMIVSCAYTRIRSLNSAAFVYAAMGSGHWTAWRGAP